MSSQTVNLGEMLLRIAKELQEKHATPTRFIPLEKAAKEQNWDQYQSILLDALTSVQPGNAQPTWATLILDLLKQLEIRHSGITTAKKKESLERVLRIPTSDPAILATKLQNLIKSWSVTTGQSNEEIVLVPDINLPEVAGKPAATLALTTSLAVEKTTIPAPGTGGLPESMDLLAQTLEFAVATQLGHAPELAKEAETLAQLARSTNSQSLEKLALALKKFWAKLESSGGQDAILHQGLLRVLRLLIDNTQLLLGDDKWMYGQVESLKIIISKPLSPQSLDEAEHRLNEVIYKQGMLQNSLQEAKAALKLLITTFIDQLSNLSKSTDGYHSNLEKHAQKIRGADDIKQLNLVLSELLEDTRQAQVDAQKTHHELIAARTRVEAAELKVQTLESEIGRISELVHEDQLTGTLNRRGMDEAFTREISRTKRSEKPLCVGLLDIDNFKHLNDTYGHQTGDDALQHLVRIVKRTMRPSDVLARYGGEEFLLLLPETQLEEAVNVLTRLQRDLTKAFFLHDDKRLLITFSAGVVLCQPDEQQTSIIERADKALYQAKNTGKNRVCIG